MRNSVLILFCVLLTACGDNDRERRNSVYCGGENGEGGGQTLGMDPGGPAYATGAYQPFSLHEPPPSLGLPESPRVASVTVQTVNRPFREKVAAIFADEDRSRIDILAVSAGGEAGAFGSGFMNGLAAASAEGGPRYDIVTGVSTGALLAPLIFVGREREYEILKDQYTNIRDRDLISKRTKLGILTSNSLYRTKKLRDRIRNVTTPEFVSELARIAKEERRVLAVMAVNLDSGWPEIFDLTAIAAGEGKYGPLDESERRNLIIAAMTASSAIPIAFPPEQINGSLYADGGARQHVFVGSEIGVAAARDSRTRSGPAPGLETHTMTLSGPAPGKQVRMFVLVNGDYRIPPACTTDSIFGIAGRTFSVTVNQMLYDSVFRLLTNAKGQGWSTFVADGRIVTAEPGQPANGTGGCVRPQGDELFNQEYMRCLYTKACAHAATMREPWCEGLDACLPRNFTLAEPGGPTVRTVPAACSINAGER